MATRRPASSRARVNNNTNSAAIPTLPRSRSAMCRSASNTRLHDVSLPRDPAPTISTLVANHASALDDAEKNIQVVIRCRQRSEREIQDNSPSIVTSKGAKSKDITIEVSTPVSSMGVVTLPPLRTYPFDLVFGPEADQAMIYHEVVAPMLDEVLMGYNCTLFAYGQTGTGKTYTMQGDLNPTPMGNPSANAGMVPRVLFRLFHHLEQSNSDYSVKVSYIELYNEELRDLLANDLSAPLGSTQPMGMASKDPSKPADNNLKIFDDSSKRGVTIQGLEEVVVKDSQAALALLTKGSLRRQIAATKFNDHSSRSHSVFSLTVHVKEAGMVGEDLLKVGKLNLVDLAGSENIGRSGAENKRAREAGMINQSLLTLGRVITALVDKASHIPYRESKLTRLLQDSLGGRTKTCIIATISPARSNMEETLSTLDYAIRAKSIRNRPELNQRTTRNSLLKDYVSEIERLKADLVAAREKNGIFFSEETWNQMNTEQELRTTELEEAKKQVQIVESKMRVVREEFDQSIGLLKMREKELKDVQKTLQDAEQVLEKKETELVAFNNALEEETIVRHAHQDTELVLDRVASGLKKAAQHSVRDLKALFEKLERKTAVLRSNTHTVLTQGNTISLAGRTLTHTLDEFVSSSTQRIVRFRSEAEDLSMKELDALALTSTRVDDQMQLLQKALNIIQAKDDLETEALEVAHKVIQDTQQTFTVDFGAWCSMLKNNSEAMSQEITSTGTETFAAVEATLRTAVSLAEAVIREVTDYVNAERDLVHQAKSLVAGASQNEIMRLREQNDLLSRTLEAERVRGSKAKDELIQQMSAFLSDFALQRDRSLAEAVETFQNGNDEGGEAMRTLVEGHDDIMEIMENDSAVVIETLKRRSGEGKRTRDDVFKATSNAKTQLNGQIVKLNGVVSESVTSYSTQLQKHSLAMSRSWEDASEQHSRAKRARVEATTSLGSSVQSEYRHIQGDVTSVCRNIKSMTERVSSEACALISATKAYHNTASASLGYLQTASKTLSEEGARDDTSTGTTPRRRTWDYEDEWNLTKPRETLVKAWREQGSSKVESETSLYENLSPPTKDGMDVDSQDEALVETENVPIREPIVASSTTSSTCTRPFKVGPGQRGVMSSVGTLTDARNVYTTRNLRRGR